MPHRISRLLVGGLLALAVFAPGAGAAAGPTVSVRVEGQAATLLPRTTVTTSTDPVQGGGNCSGTSAAGALDRAVGGNWDKQAFTQTILGETHAYAANDYWNFWINGTYSQVGICSYEVQPGDRILMLVQVDDSSYRPTVFPLTLDGVPARASRGVPFEVTVNELRTDGTATTPAPAAGATISGEGFAVTTGADGRATLALERTGTVTLTATKAGRVASDPETVCVSEGEDGTCGTRDSRPAEAWIGGIAEGQVFEPGRGPRELSGTVGSRPGATGRAASRAAAGDPSGLLMVKLRLTRNDGGRCSYFSGRREVFRPARCGAANGFWFRIGDRADWSYLLPGRLTRGRYVLDVNAIDRAYNRDDARRRGGNRIVFYVR